MKKLSKHEERVKSLALGIIDDLQMRHNLPSHFDTYREEIEYSTRTGKK